MQGRFGLVGAMVIPLALFAGCGGGSSSDPTAKFKKDYTAVRAQLKATSTAIGDEIGKASGQTDAEVGTVFKGLATRWQDNVSKLQTLKAPDKVATDFNTLMSAAQRVEADLSAVVTAAATGSASAAQQAGGSIVTDITAARAADVKIDKALGIK